MSSLSYNMSKRKRKSTDISGNSEAEINLISETEAVENCAPDAKQLKIQDEEKQPENSEILQVVQGTSENASSSGSTQDFIVISRDSASSAELEKDKKVETGNPVDLNIDKINESISNGTEEAQLANKNIREEIAEISDKTSIAECSNKLPIEEIRAETPLEDGEVLEVEDSLITVPHITVKFRDKFIADIYKKKILKLFKSFVELNIQEAEADDTTLNIFKVDDSELNGLIVIDDDVLCINDEANDELESTETPKSSKKRKKRRKKSISLETNQLFVVDTKPASENLRNNQTKYSSKFLLNEQKHSESVGDNLKSVCYNCEKDHAIKDCPLPKNYVKINANRMKMQTNKIKTTRYHLDEQKYDYLQPGKISKELKKALGLKKNQIPSYIYKMRSLGYPPGWLEDAQYTKSELTMFDIEGKNVKNTNPTKIQGLDPEKIIEYPGFNAPLGKGFKDEYKYFSVPPYSEQINRENMIKHFQTFTAGPSFEDNLAIEDMDLDCNSDTADNVEKPEHIEELIVIDAVEELTVPESLQELERQKNSILEEIKNAAETAAFEKVSANDFTDKKSVGKEDEVETAPSDCVKIPEIEEKSNSLVLNEENSICVNLDTTPINQSIKNSIFGTPVLKSNSPYNRLPEAGKFMNGISPMIDFENLPNTTGKYEQMTNVLQKVRDTLKTLQK